MANALGWLATSGVVQGIIIGATLAFLSAILVMNAVISAITTSDNGWSAIRRSGQPGNGILVRAACAKALPVVNVFDEAAYWTATRDASGHALSGRHDYVLHFPAGQLPPNDAFWSLTVTDRGGYMINNPTGRNSVGDRVPLAHNPDGSTDIYLQHRALGAHEQNWLPCPPGSFKLMLRAYLPGATILDGTYRVPPVVEAR